MTRVFLSGVYRNLSCPGLLVFLSLTFSGCATYEAHYSRFEATNSSGEPRSFLLSWQTKRYPGWAIGDDVATAVKLQSQCSEREWVLRDSSNGACEVKTGDTEQEGESAIRACGRSGADLDRRGRPIHEQGHQCMSLTDTGGSQSILGLDSDLQLTVACYPDSIEREGKGEIVNIDYLKASVVPYSIRTHTAPLYSMNERPPALDEKICEDE